MHPKETSHWLSTWTEWEKDKYGSTGRASEGTGRPSPRAIATNVTTPDALSLPSVKPVVENQRNDGKLANVVVGQFD